MQSNPIKQIGYILLIFQHLTLKQCAGSTNHISFTNSFQSRDSKHEVKNQIKPPPKRKNMNSFIGKVCISSPQMSESASLISLKKRGLNILE